MHSNDIVRQVEQHAALLRSQADNAHRAVLTEAAALAQAHPFDQATLSAAGSAALSAVQAAVDSWAQTITAALLAADQPSPPGEVPAHQTA